MDNEMISQLQFDRIKKEIKQEQLETIAKTNQRYDGLDKPTNCLGSSRRNKRSTLDLRKQSACSIYGVAEDRCTDRTSQKGLILQPTDLIEYADFLRSSRMITKFFDKNQYQTPLLFAYSKHLPDLINVEELIDQKIKIIKSVTTRHVICVKYANNYN